MAILGGGDLMMASSQRYTQAAAVVLRLNLSKNHNYISCFGIDLVEELTWGIFLLGHVILRYSIQILDVETNYPALND
jgi:hypothetical protein